jgi:hypothetical protein
MVVGQNGPADPLPTKPNEMGLSRGSAAPCQQQPQRPLQSANLADKRFSGLGLSGQAWIDAQVATVDDGPACAADGQLRPECLGPARRAATQPVTRSLAFPTELTTAA